MSVAPDIYRTEAYRIILNPNWLDTISLGCHNGRWLISADMMRYALLLTFHPEVEKTLDSIRKKLGIKINPYPEERTSKNIVLFPFAIMQDSENLNKLKVEADFLAKKFKITSDWHMPLQLKILTGVLPVPADTGGIYVHSPVEKPDGFVDKSFMFLNEGEFEYKHKHDKYEENYIFPNITITRRINSKNELREWVDKHWESHIEPAVNKLPQYLYSSSDIDKFTVSIFLWYLRNKGKNWDYISDLISNLIDKKEDLFGLDEGWLDRVTMQKMVSEVHTKMDDFYPLKNSE